ncbi:LysR family transcriptional regulator [Xylophilus rhododendri]|nr:LysR family transcriptional regulator [Xylophilus rhododendri]
MDLDAVQAFVLVADFRSFTRAAEALGSTQSAVSLKLKRLEERLQRRLLERTPRLVRLSADGLRFLGHARGLLAAHEQALRGFEDAPRRLTVGIADHLAGTDLPALLAQAGSFDPGLQLEVRIGGSEPLLRAFDKRQCDAVIVRRLDKRQDNELLFSEPFRWYAAPHWQAVHGEPLRLASQAPPCGVRALALDLLDQAGIAYREVFLGGGVTALRAAVTAGLAVAALGQRAAPVGAIDVGAALGLPALPVADVVLHSRSPEASAPGGALRLLATALRAAMPEA